VRPCSTLADAIDEANAVLAAVPAASQIEVAEQAAPLLSPGALYVDLASAKPEAKRAAAARVAAAGGSYVDGAVLGTVLISGFAVPILASGPGAQSFESLVAPDGLEVRTIDGPPGDAALVKLIRGIYLKGRDALIVEMMLTARRHGLEKIVVDSIDGPGERVPFESLVERVLRSLAVHAERRAEELTASSDVVLEAGVDPSFTQAGARTLRSVAALGLSELFGGERPKDANEVLQAIEARSGRGSG
jgi:3-hydroxyisobutyrate dehydrogenase-like beta-hydroxyacid dehydrogenase